MRFAQDLLTIFTRKERWQLTLLSIALLVRAFVELVGVASIAPFMAVVADPAIIERNLWLRDINSRFQFANAESFLFAFGVIVIALLVFCNAFSALTQWAMLRFSWDTNHRLCLRLLDGYLSQPYAYFTQVNTANLSNSILSEVTQVISGVVTPALTVVSRLLVAIALVALLLYTDFFMALVITLVLGSAYGVLYLIIRGRQLRLGAERLEANRERFRVTNEAFGGIKDVKVLGRERSFLARFESVSQAFSQATSSNATVSQLPRYLFEALAFGGMIVIVLYYLGAGRPISSILPVLSLYAFAGYRLMPELQQLFNSVAVIRFNSPSLKNLLTDLERFRTTVKLVRATPPMTFADSIRFQNVNFRYAECHEHTLKDVSFAVAKNESLGIVGASGSGKTTLVDLLLGLFPPESGRIQIDDATLCPETQSGWQQLIGYVPQQIFLTDDTIAKNIAFGIPEAEIDLACLVTAAKLAHLDQFIRSLPNGYDTIVGERGIRLSGGQRQRIGIARALYHDPQVLIMDEATSALDGSTENAVMQAIRELTGRKTILLIAHRMSTVAHCDKIIMLDRGRLIASGPFSELIEQNAQFRALANINRAASHHKPELST